MFNSTTAAQPAGHCATCGGQKYVGLVHFCGTAIRQPIVSVDISNEHGVGRMGVEVPTLEQYLDLLRRVEELERASQSGEGGAGVS